MAQKKEQLVYYSVLPNRCVNMNRINRRITSSFLLQCTMLIAALGFSASTMGQSEESLPSVGKATSNSENSVAAQHRAAAEQALRNGSEQKAAIQFFYAAEEFELIDSMFSAQKHYLKSLQIAKSIRNDSLIGASLHRLGFLYQQIQDFQAAIKCYQEASLTRIKDAQPSDAGKSIYNAALCFQQVGEFESARNLYKQADSLFREAKDLGRSVRAQQGLAEVFIETGEVRKANALLGSIISFQQAQRDTIGQIISMIDLGAIHSMQEEYQKANAIYARAKDLLPRKNEKSSLLITLLNNIGEVKFQLDSLVAANKNFETVLELTQDGFYPKARVVCLLNLARTARAEEQGIKAKAFCESGATLAQKHGFRKEWKELLSLSLEIAIAEGWTEEALLLVKDRQIVSDSLDEANRTENERIEALRTQVASNESKFYEAQTKTLLARSEQQRQKWYLIAVLALSILIISFMAFILYTNRQKLIAEQKQNHLKLEQRDMVINAVVEERQKISQDLHTDVGGMSLELHYWIDQAQQSLPDGAESVREALENVHFQSKKVSKRIRMYSHELDNTVLITDGLIKAWKNMAMEINRVRVTVKADEDVARFPLKLEHQLFRISREFINNTIKHAEATLVEIQVSVSNNQLMLILKDDGKGIENTEDLEQSGIGLKYIQQTVKEVQGSLSVENRDGTAFRIIVPLEQEDGIQNRYSR